MAHDLRGDAALFRQLSRIFIFRSLLSGGSGRGGCPSVRVVEFLGRADPDLGCIDLGEPSDECTLRLPVLTSDGEYRSFLLLDGSQ